MQLNNNIVVEGKKGRKRAKSVMAWAQNAANHVSINC